MRAEELTAFLGRENQRIPLEELDHRIGFSRRKLENSGAGTIEILPGFRYPTSYGSVTIVMRRRQSTPHVVGHRTTVTRNGCGMVADDMRR